MIRTLAIGLLSVMILTACGGKQKETEWGIYNEPVKAGPLPEAAGAEELKVDWRHSVGDSGEDGYAILRPAIDELGVYVSNRKGDVQRIDAATGKVVWRQKVGKAVFAAVGLGEGIAVACLDDGSVIALDAETGEQRWSTNVKRQISAIPAAGSGRVVVRTSDGLVIGLNSFTGEQVWSVQRPSPGLSLHGDSTPLIEGDTVITGLSNGKIMANAVINGRDYWETDLSFVQGTNELERLSDVDSPPVLAGTSLYAATYQGDVVSVDLQSSSVRWRQKLSTRLPLSVTSENIFVTSALGSVAALNLDDGAINWQVDAFQGRGMSNPLALGNRVIVGDAEGFLHLLDNTDGTLLQSLRVNRSAIVSLVALGNGAGNGFIGFTADGTVISVSLEPV